MTRKRFNGRCVVFGLQTLAYRPEDMDKERKPLLNDGHIASFLGPIRMMPLDGSPPGPLLVNMEPITDSHEAIFHAGMKQARDYYEAMIDGGTLSVTKTIARDQVKEHVLFQCADNMMDAMDTYFHTYIHFCPGCGAKIID